MSRPPSLVEKRFKCTFDDCDKAYNKPCKLEDHLRSHTGERPFLCSSCDKTFLRDSHLHAHLRSHLPANERKYGCEQEGCKQRFNTSQHFRKHMDQHSRPTPYACTFCDQSFHKNFQLKRHIGEEHTGTKPCPCPYIGCTLSFKYQSILDTHYERVHEKVKTYLCAVQNCTEMFVRWTALQAHIREAHPVKCTYCDKIFAVRDYLTEHLKLHEVPLFDRQKYPCDVDDCVKKFTKASALKKHIEAVHEGRRPFNCPYCPKDFIHKRNLNQHLIRDHSVNSLPSIQGRKRKKLTKEVDILQALTGVGYEDSGRDIPCTVPECNWRFVRQYDLDRHIDSQHLALPLPLEDRHVRTTTLEAEISRNYGRQAPARDQIAQVQYTRVDDLHHDDARDTEISLDEFFRYNPAAGLLTKQSQALPGFVNHIHLAV